MAATTPAKTNEPLKPGSIIRSLQKNQVVTPMVMRQIADEIMPVIAKSLPAQFAASASRYAHALVNEMMRNPSLGEASAISLIGCMMQASTLGLEIGGITGHCYPVPYYNKDLKCKVANLQVGYKGFIALAGRSDKVASFDAHIVYEGDTFGIDLGSHPRVEHKPAIVGVREKIIGYYAVLKTSVNGTQIRWMTQAEMEVHRKRFADERSQAWRDNFVEMGRKTVLRSLAKYVPISVELTTAASLDEYADTNRDQGMGAMGRSILDMAGVPPDAPQMETTVMDQLGDHGDDNIPN